MREGLRIILSLKPSQDALLSSFSSWSLQAMSSLPSVVVGFHILLFCHKLAQICKKTTTTTTTTRRRTKPANTHTHKQTIKKKQLWCQQSIPNLKPLILGHILTRYFSFNASWGRHLFSRPQPLEMVGSQSQIGAPDIRKRHCTSMRSKTSANGELCWELDG